MSEENKKLIHRWFEEVWNKQNEDAIDEMFAENGIANGLNDAEGNPLRGPQNYKTLHRAFIAAYPDIKITVEDVVAEGDKLTARCRVTGTHTGDGLGIRSTNNSIDFTGLAMVEIADGKIVEAWNEFDFMKMYSQLGALQLKTDDVAAQNDTKLIYRWFEEVWNQKRESAINEMMTDETVHYGLGNADGQGIRGIENFKKFWRDFIEIFPDIHVEIKDATALDGTLTARYTVSATHTGDGLGMTASGRPINFDGMGICKFADGKFIEVWNQVDFLTMYSRLGVLSLDLK